MLDVFYLFHKPQKDCAVTMMKKGLLILVDNKTSYYLCFYLNKLTINQSGLLKNELVESRIIVRDPNNLQIHS